MVSRRLLLLAVVAVLGSAATACGAASGEQGLPAPTYEYVIPEGSGDLIARGEPLDILPQQLDAVLGETIQIVNDDTIGHVLGPWFVGAGETIRQRFANTGTVEGYCSVHPDESFTITVTST